MFLMQTSNKDSWFLYSKTKGQAEEAVTNLGFDRLSIYRPALLLCDRNVILLILSKLLDHPC